MKSFTTKFSLRNFIYRLLSVFFVLTLFVGISIKASAANRFSVATGAWSSTNTWASTSGGSPGASVPVAADNVTIEGGWTVTANNNAVACLNLVVSSGSQLNLNIGITINGTTTISGTIYFDNRTPPGSALTYTFTSNVTLNSTAIWDETSGGINGVFDQFNFGGNLTNNISPDANFKAIGGIGAGGHLFDNNLSNNKSLSGTCNTSIPVVNINRNFTVNVGAKLSVTNYFGTVGGYTLTKNGSIYISGTNSFD